MSETLNTHEYKEDCTEKVKEWLRIDDEVKEIMSKVKMLKQRQKEISHYIIHYMKVGGIENLTFSGGYLEFSTKKIKETLSKKKMSTLLNEYYKDDNSKAGKLLNYINENQAIKEKVQLKRHIKK
tara:strand:+ start:223 stop:597 length:375 start_codon:yes stop_codon:yes gene_type:complete